MMSFSWGGSTNDARAGIGVLSPRSGIGNGLSGVSFSSILRTRFPGFFICALVLPIPIAIIGDPLLYASGVWRWILSVCLAPSSIVAIRATLAHAITCSGAELE